MDMFGSSMELLGRIRFDQVGGSVAVFVNDRRQLFVHVDPLDVDEALLKGEPFFEGGLLLAS